MLSEETKKAIEQEADDYGFQVPYNGTQEFYNHDKVKAFIAGATLYASKVEELEKENGILKAIVSFDEVPSTPPQEDKSAKDLLQELGRKYITCTCDVAYLTRNLAAPDCPFHNADFESVAIEYANSQTKKLRRRWRDWLKM